MYKYCLQIESDKQIQHLNINLNINALKVKKHIHENFKSIIQIIFLLYLLFKLNFNEI